MKFYGQFKNPSVDQYLYKEFFRDKKGGVFIECGAANGIADASCKVFEEFLGWTGINIEAHPGIFTQLQKNRPNSLNINHGLTSAEDDGKVLKFNTYDFKKGCSLIRTFGAHAPIGFLESAKKHREDIDVAGTMLDKTGQLTVTGISYKSLVEKYDVTNVDLFVLDVEGSELDVIKGMEGCKVLPTVFCIEANKIDLDVLDKMMCNLGYTYYSTVHINAHYIRKG